MKNFKDLVDNMESFVGKTIINMDMGMSAECIIDKVSSGSTMEDQNLYFHFKSGEKWDHWSLHPSHTTVSPEGFLGFEEPHIAINSTYTGKFVILL